MDAGQLATEAATASGESGPSDSDTTNSGFADSRPVILPDGPDPGTVVPSADDTDTVEPFTDDPLPGLADEHEMARITTDVRTTPGVDKREYDLVIEDAVTLLVTNVDLLVERGAVE